MIRSACFIVIAICLAGTVCGEEVTIDFENILIHVDTNNDEVVNRAERYVEKEVEFKLARQPEHSKAKGKIMFVAHPNGGRKGILNAMANEQQIPVQVRFAKNVTQVTIVFWASTGAPAKMEAFDSNGEVVAQDGLKVSPSRTRPENPIPTFELTVKADNISYIEFSGPRDGEYLVADELRFETSNKAADTCF